MATSKRLQLCLPYLPYALYLPTYNADADADADADDFFMAQRLLFTIGC